jgi:hypothetical protein
LHVKSLSTGTALTALHVWISDLSKALESREELPPVLGIYTGTRKNKSSPSVIEPYLIEHNAPFQKDNKIYLPTLNCDPTKQAFLYIMVRVFVLLIIQNGKLCGLSFSNKEAN